MLGLRGVLKEDWLEDVGGNEGITEAEPWVPLEGIAVWLLDILRNGCGNENVDEIIENRGPGEALQVEVEAHRHVLIPKQGPFSKISSGAVVQLVE